MDIDALLASLPARISDIPRRWAALAPDAPALSEAMPGLPSAPGARRVWTYGELVAAVDAAAERLRALGVRPGDRLMVVAENSVAQVVLIFAAASMDAWIVNANSRLSAREIDQFREHAGARRVIYCSGVSPEAAAHGERHGAQREHWLFGEWMIGPLNDSPAAAPEPVASGADFSARQPAALIYTTGTTGQSKGVMLSHRNLLFIAAVSSTLRGLTPADRAYGVLPISHVYGLASVMLGTLYAGACLHLQPRFAVDALLHALRDEHLTILQGVPAMYARLLEAVGQQGGATLRTSLRFAYAGGSPLDPVLKRQVEALLGQPLHNGYGMTESSPTISQTRLDAPRGDTSVGYAIPGVETRLVAASGPSQGGTGELWVRGPNVMLGYYKEPALTAAAIDADGWLNTGDVARQDPDGALFIVGRTKELIIRSGFNVYPLEVETVLNAHPAVAQSAVVGRPAADGNEEVIAYVELDPRHAASGAAQELIAELHAHLAASLSPYKCPTEIIPMQALPAAATGKILKSQLRQLAQGRAQQMAHTTETKK
ncbi:class I adenylate-forming enzyme family protein [Pseudoduganella sp. UC29_71]|jgi:acyl-CoA synthetase (AMP-forming)/AMP-acid ligase II|uniref:class I adenylate-forming enzyme family protein n=1 Tax=Pseudoduganella sp. UC29_71 TaxID=3350174 RepID=UPI00366DE57E